MFDERRVVGRVRGFVAEACGDPVFRRRLRYRPAAALADHGLSGALAPERLPVRHYEVDVTLDEAHLFGLPSPPTPASPPLGARLVSLGIRPLCLVHGGERELTLLRAWAARRSLVGLLSPDEFSSRADEGKGGYTNLIHDRRPAQAGSGAMRGLLLGPDENQVILGWLSLLFGWDDLLGRLLGYPACCTAAFVERWRRAALEHQGDPAALSLEASPGGPFDWRLNVFGRYFGASLIEHFPCTFRCEASLEVARRAEAALRLFEPEAMAAIEAVLDAPVVYTERQGVFAFPGGRVERAGGGLRLAYEPARVLSTEPGGALSDAIARRRELACQGAALSVGPDLRAEGHLVAFSAEPFDT